jgi:hypothetical protein
MKVPVRYTVVDGVEYFEPQNLVRWLSGTSVPWPLICMCHYLLACILVCMYVNIKFCKLMSLAAFGLCACIRTGDWGLSLSWCAFGISTSEGGRGRGHRHPPPHITRITGAGSPRAQWQVAAAFKYEQEHHPDEFLDIATKRLGTSHSWITLRAMCKLVFRTKFQAKTEEDVNAAFAYHPKGRNQHGSWDHTNNERRKAAADEQRRVVLKRRLDMCKFFASLIPKSSKFKSYSVTKRRNHAHGTDKTRREYIPCDCDRGNKNGSFHLDVFTSSEHGLDPAEYTDKVSTSICRSGHVIHGICAFRCTKWQTSCASKIANTIPTAIHHAVTWKRAHTRV